MRESPTLNFSMLSVSPWRSLCSLAARLRLLDRHHAEALDLDDVARVWVVLDAHLDAVVLVGAVGAHFLRLLAKVPVGLEGDAEDGAVDVDVIAARDEQVHLGPDARHRPLRYLQLLDAQVAD